MKLWEVVLWIGLLLAGIFFIAWGVVVLATRPPHDTYKCTETSSVTFECVKS